MHLTFTVLYQFSLYKELLENNRKKSHTEVSKVARFKRHCIKSKLLDERAVKSAKETLEKMQKRIYVTKKIKCCIATVAKICCISRTTLTT